MIRQWNIPRHGGSVIPTQDIIQDHGSDIVIAKLRRLNRLVHWNWRKCRLRDELEALCPFHGYIGFRADYRAYGLHRVGQSFQYDVPLNKRGHLKLLAGKRVRLICLYSGAYRIWVRAGAVASTSAVLVPGRR